MKRSLLLPLPLVLFLACGEKPAPAPPPAPPAGTPTPGFLRPLTSRDGGAPIGMGSLPPGHPPDPSRSVSGQVVFGPGLGERTRATDVLFLIARDPQKKIVAVRREAGVTFPFAFTLSAADAMTEGTTFAGPFEITARLSRTGDATPGAGDIEGVASGVALGARDARVTLDTVRK